MTKFRKGSMGAADEKDRKKVLIGAAVIYLFILLCFFAFPFFYTVDIAKRAGALPNILGTVFVLASYACLYFESWFESKKAGSDWRPILIALFLLLGIAIIGGFNFDLRGLAQR